MTEKALVVYDSVYGNTQKLAEVIAKTLNAQAKRTTQVKHTDLKDIELLIVGTPTHGGRPSPAMQTWVANLPSLEGINVAAFDTGIPGTGFGLKLLVKILGYASPRLAKSLVAKGGHLIIQPVTFFVTDKAGPLIAGELDRAVAWAKTII